MITETQPVSEHTGQQATQTTEAPQTGAPQTLAEALQRIAELKREIEVTREIREDGRIREVAADIGSGFAKRMGWVLADQIAEKLGELKKTVSAGVNFDDLLSSVRDADPAEDFDLLHNEDDLPLDLVLECVEAAVARQLAEIAAEVAEEDSNAEHPGKEVA